MRYRLTLKSVNTLSDSGEFGRIGISIPLHLLEQIDASRGMVPRSTYMAALLNKAMEVEAKK